MAKGVKGSTLPKEEQPVKTSLAIPPTMMDKIRHIALKTRRQISVVVADSLSGTIEDYEKEYGEIK